jgi:hypothetical protein
MCLARALSAEWLKLRRTLALWLVPIAPLVIVALQLAIVLERTGYYRQQGFADIWENYAQQTVFLWALLMLPLFITLETALLGNLEHANQQWKHLFALPVSRGALYGAKQLIAMLLIGLSMLALYLTIVVSGLAIRLIVPGLGFEAPVPWLRLLQYVGLAYLASWLVIAIHTWVSLRWRSFVVAIAVGIGAMVVAVVIFQSGWNRWYPWTLPGMITYSLEEGLRPWVEVGLGGLGGIAAAALGGWNVTRRDVL